MFNDVVTAVQSIGVSAVFCLLSAWFVKYQYDKFMNMIEDMDKRHKQEVDSLSTTIHNNTIVMEKILTVLESKGE